MLNVIHLSAPYAPTGMFLESGRKKKKGTWTPEGQNRNSAQTASFAEEHHRDPMTTLSTVLLFPLIQC